MISKPKPIKKKKRAAGEEKGEEKNFTDEEKVLLEAVGFYVRKDRYGADRATYSLLNPEGTKPIFVGDSHEGFLEVSPREQSLYCEYKGKFVAKFWGRGSGPHWDAQWVADEIKDFDFSFLQNLCDAECEKHLPQKTKLQILELKFLPQFSNAPVEEWEKECARIRAESEANKKIIKIEKEGYLIKYPSGTEKFENQYLPPWAKKLLPITSTIKAESPWGEVEISPIKWEEEKVEKEVVVLPSKPEPIQGFDLKRSNQVALICNEVFGTNWHWFDVDCHSIRDGCKTFEWEGKILKIFPDKYELYEVKPMSKEEIISSLREEIKVLQKME